MDVSTGKSAKRGGALHPKHARQIDQDPQRVGKKAQAKRYGFTVERNFWNTRSWTREVYSWHATESARDQALEAFKRKLNGWHGRWYRDPQPIDRLPPTTSGTTS